MCYRTVSKWDCWIPSIDKRVSLIVQLLNKHEPLAKQENPPAWVCLQLQLQKHMHSRRTKLHHPLFAICYNWSEYCVSIDDLCCCNEEVVAHSFLQYTKARGMKWRKLRTKVWSNFLIHIREKKSVAQLKRKNYFIVKIQVLSAVKKFRERLCSGKQ